MTRTNAIVSLCVVSVLVYYGIYHYNTGLWDYLGDASFYVSSASWISEKYGYIERLFPGNYYSIASRLNIPHIFYPLILSYFTFYAEYGPIILNVLVFAPGLCFLFLLLGHQRILGVNKVFVTCFASGAIFWASVPMKETLLFSAFLAYYYAFYFWRPPDKFLFSKFLIICFLLASIYYIRFWYPLLMISGSCASYLIVRLKPVINWRIPKLLLFLTPFAVYTGIKISSFSGFLDISLSSTIQRILQPNPFNLISSPFTNMFLQALVFKLIFVLVIFVIVIRPSLIFKSQRHTFLLLMYVFNTVALSGSVLRGERHQFISHLSIVLFAMLVLVWNKSSVRISTDLS